MNMKSTLVAVVAISGCLALGQTESLPRRKVANAGNAPLTMTEASVAFTRVEKVLGRVVGIPLSLPKLPSGNLPARRSDVIARMDRIFELCRPQFKFTPKKVRFDPKILGLPANHPQRAPLERLIRWGCVGKATPFAVSKSEVLAAGEFGDAIGNFLLRIADVTHRPDPNFSPIIGGGID